jgi:tellurite resistance protein
MVKFLADGILSDRERAKLGALARALEVDAARLKRLEEEAKTERYRQAVSDALSDGTVSAEEARMLNELRTRFGIGGPKWTPGDLVPRG